VLQANHIEALQLLLHYELPVPPNGPATLVQDAIFLERNRNFESGARLIVRYSGLRPEPTRQHRSEGRRPPSLQLSQKHRNNLSPAPRTRGSPGRSPARFLSPQKGLENVIQEVSGALQKRSEGWKVSLRAAAGEVRRNVNNMQSGTASPRSSIDASERQPFQQRAGQETKEDLETRLSMLEKRNKTLARMLADAIEELRAQKESSEPTQARMVEESFNVALAKMQFVQVYLADSEIPIPGPNGLPDRATSPGHLVIESNPDFLPQDSEVLAVAQQSDSAIPDGFFTPPTAVERMPSSEARDERAEVTPTAQDQESGKLKLKASKLPPSRQPRPALAQSPLSWILGEGQHRSDFVSSSIPPPEQRRDSAPKVKPKRLFPDGKDNESRDASESEDDGFTMSSLHGNKARN
jgi:TBC1 domain family member 5